MEIDQIGRDLGDSKGVMALPIDPYPYMRLWIRIQENWNEQISG